MSINDDKLNELDKMLVDSVEKLLSEYNDSNLDRACKLLELINGLRGMKQSELVFNMQENMKNVDFSKVDFNSMLNSLMKEGI